MRCATPVVLLLVGGLATGQVVTSPPGFATIEGDLHAELFASFPDHRVMLFDGEVAGTLVVKSVSIRSDHSPVPRAVGRSWRSLSLDVSTCDMTRLSTTFSRNPTSTPTRVFSASVNWPTGTTPSSYPGPWGGPTGSLAFPFASPWPRAANQDTCLDFDFQGGALLGRSWPTQGEPYDVDGMIPASASISVFTSLRFGGGGLGPGPGCADSALPHRGYLEISGTVHRSGPLAGTSTLRTTSWVTAPNGPVIHALGTRGSTTGWPFPGVTCNRLYVDPGPTTAFFPAVAFADGHADVQLGSFKHSVAFEGVPLWGQAAWVDSGTSATRLTSAEFGHFPRMPRSYRRQALFQRDPTRKATDGLLTGGESWNPILGYGL